ncbi:MAG: LD-carboxypeptidase [Bacteroidetes bacterium]|nr:LD-carboxypeptidase [Bacteroidota bacterium]
MSSTAATAAGFTRPPRLRRGATIGIVAPSSPQRDDERLRNGIRYFESLGYTVRCGEHLWKRLGYLAGTDDERIEDLNAMIRDPDVRMIVAGRGGYGMTRIIDRVDYRALRRDPKIIVGFSDLTALNMALLKRSGLVSFSGAMAGVDLWDIGNIDPLTEEIFWRAITSTRPLRMIRQPEGHPIESLHRGTAEGWLLAGNLTLLASITGTPFLPAGNDAVFMCEEIGEEAYRVDRLLSQLWNSGLLKRANAIAFGAFTNAKPTRISVDPLPMEAVLSEYVQRAGVPAIGGLLYGHIPTKLTLPLGVRVRIDGTRATMRVLESGVS